MENEAPKSEWSLKVPKPSKRTAKTALTGVAAVSLLAMFYNAKSYSTRARTVIWQGGEVQTNWKPTIHDFRNSAYNVGITEDGFIVARPIKLPPPAPAPIVPPPEKAVTPLTNK